MKLTRFNISSSDLAVGTEVDTNELSLQELLPIMRNLRTQIMRGYQPKLIHNYELSVSKCWP
jgi:hypothetical protein